MVKNVVIAAMAALLIWFGSAIISLERYRYASSLGMCGPVDAARLPERDKCLSETETRTSTIFHLLYGLGVL